MTRKKFLQDLERAKQNPPAHITNIQHHEDDGLKFTYLYQEDGVPREAHLVLLPTNVDEYPSANEFIIYEDDRIDNQVILTALEPIRAIIDHMTVSSALQEVSGGLHQALTKGCADNPILLTSDGIQSPKEPQQDLTGTENDNEESDFDDIENDGYDSDEDFGFEVPKVSSLNLDKRKSSRDLAVSNLVKIKTDLRAAKHAGFRVGVYGDLQQHGGIVSVSIRIGKLGISEEAMQAWSIKKKQYFVLVIRFPNGYRDLSEVKEQRDLAGKVDMHVALCDKHKPRYEEALRALNTAGTKDEEKKPQPGGADRIKAYGTLEPLFIGRPINELLKDRFAQIIQFRSWGFSWSGAEHCYNHAQGSSEFQIPHDIDEHNNLDSQLDTRALPAVVKNDSLSATEIKKASLPLVAMQFVLRHFVRCTEFCLVCHRQLSDSFEALKPYVCSKPLCLYQYLKHGFGPSIEWEIISQPYVIDLLVSLCYAQAQAGRLKELPKGVDLMVPLLKEYDCTPQSTIQYPGRLQPKVESAALEKPLQVMESFSGTLMHRTNILQITPSASTESLALRKGDWIAVTSAKFASVHHYCIADVVETIIHLHGGIKTQSMREPTTTQIGEASEVQCFLYDTSLDSLSPAHQHRAINAMLDTLPSVSLLQQRLVQQRVERREPSLKSLADIPPTARTLLRWIVASNRSCIMQVDRVCRDSLVEPEQTQASEPRVSGMDDWMQFRFAQGAPDKEQRFVDCVKQTTGTKVYPTIFAWHGSPLHNWHSIVRTGLNFDDTIHGRAHGHGVYMSPYLTTSLGYSNMHTQMGSHGQWPNSELKVSSVVSLQEVVNATDKFVASKPHYVVAQKEWIQTRYLFVKTSVKHSVSSAMREVVQQDPAHPVMGSTSHVPIKIPINAVTKSRRGASTDTPSHSKRARFSEVQAGSTEDDTMSDSTDDEDRRMIAFSDDEFSELSQSEEDILMTDLESGVSPMMHSKSSTESSTSSDGRKRKSESSRYRLDPTKTDFSPGDLDTSDIKFLPPPIDASPAATKALLKAFNETLKVQKTTLQHELGFFLDPDRMENMYQWIVELHSFDPSLQLSKDMKLAKIQSVVLEMRFTPDFPYSPPFVRVVKPQFLPFMQGGGGHVTEGGAICMELLTSTGWSVVNSIESVLLQVRLALSETERPARLMLYRGQVRNTCYQMNDAISAFRRACMKHGWTVPRGIDSLL